MGLPPQPIINPADRAPAKYHGSDEKVPKAFRNQNRWRAGKAPEINDNDDEQLDLDEKPKKEEVHDVQPDLTDRRLRRLAEGRKEGVIGTRQREVVEAEVVVGDEDTPAKEEPMDMSESDDDEDKLEARRERLRQIALERRKEEEEEDAMPVEEEEEAEQKGESSSSWEYESESESEDDRKLIKPVFISKQKRDTIEEKNKIYEEEQAEEEARLKRMEERRQETRQIVAEALLKEKKMQLERTTRQARELTESEGNEDVEYDKWRIRELTRLKRDREEREKWEREKVEVERRRKMTDEQVIAENEAIGKGKKEKAQMVMMQRYHHKGVFFMENDEKNRFKEEIYNRDTNQATDADKATARLAATGPHEGSKIFQVRRGYFGKMGQTKWTHLTNEDTTKFDSPWTQDDSIRQKFQTKMGGMSKKK
uniref:Micro-fibrillar-associated protein 1 C-terminal domain-containing protein n=1 Tax=Hanusia phi TaxID=3032 RepID=A0A7S0NCT5_9CRYP|mmetsp:Transcript_6619/g.15156  ORF Transcript_6619/g.15156 Transcript_6619/m.15156 type:complete len:424 (+) Transcript_6619:88-1359(+)